MSRQLSALFLLGCLLAHAQAINVQNRSFETATLPINGGNGPFCQLIAGSTIAGYVQSGSVANWTASSTTKNAGVGVSAPTPAGNNWTTKWWNGNNIAFVQATSAGTASLSQTLADVLQNNMVYTLSAQIGRPILAALDSEPVKFEYALQLWAGTTMLGSASNLALANNSSGMDSLTYSSGANNPQAGQPLMIVLTTSGANGVITEAFFDNVTLAAASPAPPSIFTSGIVPIYSSSPVIEPGSWVSIYGSNLASSTMVWNGDFPISLGGTSVTINSKPAYLWFVSPTQINLQAPDDTATGTVPVVVTTAAGSSSSTVTLAAYAPSFSLLSSKYPAAIVLTPGSPGNSGGGYDIIGPVGAFSYPARPIKAGEVLILYGVGFGPTTPAVPAGSLVSDAAISPVFPTVTIGGVPATVAFSGIVEAGLFQLNVIMPTTGSGDQVLQAMIGGVSTQSNVFITVQ